MIVSNDSIMKPPYEITDTILRLVASISEKIGAISANFLDRPSPQLRKRNKIKTIHSSLKIEGNTLTEAQITALLENKRVIGPEKDIREVLNAVELYERLSEFQAESEESLLQAHQLLMKGLLDSAGKYRTDNVGIVQGDRVTHLAPPAANVSYLMGQLFDYLRSTEELALIKRSMPHKDSFKFRKPSWAIISIS